MDRDLGRFLCSRSNKKIYVNGDTLTKVYDPVLMPKAKVLWEAWMQSVAETTELDVPKVKRVYPVDDFWAIDLDYIAGESLEQQMQNHPEEVEKSIDSLVDIQMSVLATACVGLPDMKDKFNRKISALGRTSDPRKHVEATIRYELHVALDRMPAHRKLCHGDLLPDNILFDSRSGRPFIFDWAHASLGDAGADAAHTYLKMIIEGHRDWAECYLKSYARKTDTALQYLRSWFPIVSATMLDQVDSSADIKMLQEIIATIEE